MLTRRQLLQSGTSLALGARLVQEEFLQAAQAEANPVKITAVKVFLLETRLKRAFGVSI